MNRAISEIGHRAVDSIWRNRTPAIYRQVRRQIRDIGLSTTVSDELKALGAKKFFHNNEGEPTSLPSVALRAVTGLAIDIADYNKEVFMRSWDIVFSDSSLREKIKDTYGTTKFGDTGILEDFFARFRRDYSSDTRLATLFENKRNLGNAPLENTDVSAFSYYPEYFGLRNKNGTLISVSNTNNGPIITARYRDGEDRNLGEFPRRIRKKIRSDLGLLR